MAEAMKYEADLQRQLALATASYEQTALSVGMGSKEAERAQARLSLEQDTNNKVLALRTELATATTDKQRQALESQIALTQQYGARQLAAMQQGYVNLDAAQGDWRLGAKSAFSDYLEAAKDVAGQTKTAFTSAFGSMEDSLNTFSTTGKFKFRDLATSIITDMGRIASRKASSALLGMLFDAGVSYLGSGGGGSGTATSAGSTAAGYSDAALSGWSGVAQAKGGAWSGGVQMFAEGAAFTNSIVSTPTAFGMAGGGAGVMGEAGPEAIMPLARGSDGSLGVRMVGGAAPSGGTVVKVEAPVYLTVEDRSGEGMELDSAALQQNMQRQMLGVAQKAIADSWRPRRKPPKHQWERLMAVETFVWAPDDEASCDSTLKTRKSRFGDGYVQVSSDGLNAEEESWSLSFGGLASESSQSGLSAVAQRFEIIPLDAARRRAGSLPL